jgi:hypothetical protein
MPEQSVCRSCGAPIRWAVTRATGARIPLNPEPVPGGNIVVEASGFVRVLGRGEEAPPGARFVSHFVTCPFAAAHRKAR